ncbi:MAG: hypothetical protein IK076_04270, partial [Bacteroidales bacterium]|nr:hypothetical protein [Bacteroidales bacterium]
SQRHLSAESGLYCRAIIEGMFGIRPTGLKSFRLTPRLAEGWNDMALKHIRAFGGDFDIDVRRLPGNKLEVVVEDNVTGTGKTWKVPDGNTIEIKLTSK